MDSNTLAKVEEQRQQLESNIANLRKALRHWQTLEIDYEGLKEEFSALPVHATSAQCMQAAKDFKPELVDEKELENLIVSDRTPSQVVNLLSKRTDYVGRNIEAIRKQLSAVQKQWNALVLVEDPEHREEAGLPLREIAEELDEEGNVISTKVIEPGNEAANLVEVLRRAGVTSLPEDEADAKVSAVYESKTDDLLTEHDQQQLNRKEENVSIKDIEPFDNKTTLPQNDNKDQLQIDMIQSTNARDTEAEAKLREEMLQYGLGEVGAIVAELDLEENPSNVSYDYDDEFSDYDDDDDDDEDDLYTDESENESGAGKRPIISDRYRRKMEALQRKHGIKDMQNLGPEPELPKTVEQQTSRPTAAEAARKAAIARDDAMKSSIASQEDTLKRTRTGQKKVAFAEELDIAPSNKSRPVVPPEIDPMGEHVVERPASSTTTIQPPSQVPKKVSRFKSMQMARNSPADVNSATNNKAPLNQIVANTLVERAAIGEALAPDPLDFDEEIHRREIATEYQKLRNRKIHEQGGYVGGGEQDNYGEDFAPLTVEDNTTEQPKKISRFKAARFRP